jgi:hypothetical protein
MNHPFSLTLRDLLENSFLFHVETVCKSTCYLNQSVNISNFHKPYIKAEFHNYSQCAGFTNIPLHKVFENKLFMFSSFFLSESLAVEFITQLSFEVK